MSKWLQEPIVVLPIAFATAFLLALPFIVSGTDDAAKFYGAYFAAITGLAGVVAGAMVNAHLQRQRDDRLERVKVIAAARVARFELSELKSYLDVSRQLIPMDRADVTKVSPGDPRTSNLINTGRSYSLTPTLDTHLLALCQQGEKLAESLLKFSEKRATLRQAGERAREHNPVQNDWGHVAVLFHLLESNLDSSMAELQLFINKHSGDFA